MEQTVYIDLLFLINFSMDFLCFYVSSRIISVKLPTLRAVIASVIGGIYADAALFIPSGFWLSFVIDLAVCFVMCTIVFYKKEEKNFFSLFPTLVYFSVSMALGGFMTAIFNILNRMGFNKAVIDDGDSDGISVWLFAILALVSALLTLIGGKFFKRRSSVSSVELELVCGGKKRRIQAVVDSGNFLCEPISGKACIAVDIGALLGLVDNQLIDIAKSKELSMLEKTGQKTMRRVRLVPARTAVGESMLIGLRMDAVRIDSGKGMYDTDAIIVMSELERDRCGAKALVPAGLLK